MGSKVSASSVPSSGHLKGRKGGDEGGKKKVYFLTLHLPFLLQCPDSRSKTLYIEKCGGF